MGLAVMSSEQPDSRARTASRLSTTAGQLEDTAESLRRSAEASRDEGTRRRLRKLGDAVAAEAGKIRARITGMSTSKIKDIS